MNNKKQYKVKEDYLTYEDYAQLPDDGGRFELVDGALQAMSPSPNPIHQLVSQELAFKFKQCCKNDFVIFTAPIDLIISRSEVRQPDIVLVRLDKLNIVTKRGIEGVPELVLEILSPSSIKRDRLEKLTSYASYGIPEYWLIDPLQKYLEQYVLVEESYQLIEIYTKDQVINSTQIPCASFSMEEIFSEIPKLPNMDGDGK